MAMTTFICEKPKGATLIDFLGPWPWYILGLEIIGTALFFIMYSPYLIADLLHAKPKGPSQTLL